MQLVTFCLGLSGLGIRHLDQYSIGLSLYLVGLGVIFLSKTPRVTWIGMSVLLIGAATCMFAMEVINLWRLIITYTLTIASYGGLMYYCYKYAQSPTKHYLDVLEDDQEIYYVGETVSNFAD
jgi:hypothetical protein